MRKLKLLDLFSGIGGFTLAAEKLGIETVAFCEIDRFPQYVLKFVEVVRQNNMGGISVSNDVPTLTANAGAGRIPMAVSIRENIINRQDHNGGNGVGAIEENCYTLNASGVHAVATRSDVRRLTPLECERLQGFPDNWTLTPTACDTNRYKALGNAITVNVAEWIFKRLKECTN